MFIWACISISIRLFEFHWNFCRRVHITKTTLDYLDDKFEVEPGGGASRDAYLSDHKVETYLIIPPKVSKQFYCCNTQHQCWSQYCDEEKIFRHNSIINRKRQRQRHTWDWTESCDEIKWVERLVRAVCSDQLRQVCECVETRRVVVHMELRRA